MCLGTAPAFLEELIVDCSCSNDHEAFAVPEAPLGRESFALINLFSAVIEVMWYFRGCRRAVIFLTCVD